LLPRFAFQTSEGTLSLAAEEAQPPLDRRPGRSPLAVAALVLAAVLGLAACTGGPASTSVSPVQALPTAPASAAQRLSETGSSLMAPLFALWGPGLILLRFALVPAAIGPLILARSRRYAE
jgi:hypothetical protein